MSHIDQIPQLFLRLAGLRDLPAFPIDLPQILEAAPGLFVAGNPEAGHDRRGAARRIHLCRASPDVAPGGHSRSVLRLDAQWESYRRLGKITASELLA